MSLEQLLNELGGRFKCLKLHSNGSWTADERRRDKTRQSLSMWADTPEKALSKLLNALESEACGVAEK